MRLTTTEVVDGDEGDSPHEKKVETERDDDPKDWANIVQYTPCLRGENDDDYVEERKEREWCKEGKETGLKAILAKQSHDAESSYDTSHQRNAQILSIGCLVAERPAAVRGNHSTLTIRTEIAVGP